MEVLRYLEVLRYQHILGQLLDIPIGLYFVFVPRNHSRPYHLD